MLPQRNTARPGEIDPIKHVLVLALENRSFDHMLGACQKVKSGIDGVAPNGKSRTNTFGRKHYRQVAGAARVVVEDPRHETPHVLAQLKKDRSGEPNQGFVEDYAKYYHMLTDEGRAEIMKYHDLDTLPALHTLARHFTVCNRWFSSVPGPTWANRLFLMSGTSLGHVDMPEGLMDLNLHWYDQHTIFDRLNEKSKSWAVYHGDTPLSLLLVHQWEPHNAARYKRMVHFFADVAGDEAAFPDFVLIEPAYLDPGANDDHPSHDVLAGEALIASVYNALRANEALWNTSLLIVLFDEHGGFYDHVSPPEAEPPDHHQHGFAFDQLGVRVPAILVSPFAVDAVCDEVLDHTSLLKYLIDKWQLGSLQERAAKAKTFEGALCGRLRTDTPRQISAVPSGLTPPLEPPHRPLNSHQGALVALSHALESMAGEEPGIVAARSREVITGPQSQIDVAVDRVDAFLKHAGAMVLKDV